MIRRSSIAASGLVLVAVLSQLACAPGAPTIGGIQGTQQYSPLAASRIAVEAVVTAELPGEGFFVESASHDSDSDTSDGLLVIGGSATPGDRVLLTGVVVEVQRNPEELPTTTISVNTDGSGVSVLASGVALPKPKRLSEVRADTLEAAISFWESLEGMRVQVESARVVGPSNRYGESAVLIGGTELPPEIATINRRGAAVLVESRYLPPRILLDDSIARQPAFQVGDRLGEFVAIVDYRFGEYRLLPLETLEAAETSSIERESSSFESSPDSGASAFFIASINVENLDLGDDPRRFQSLAEVVVSKLGAPELIALQEMQDDSGPLDDGELSSEGTHRRLIEAIRTLGGPAYSFREVRPANNADGGEPWGNIRCSFLFRTDSGLSFVDVADGDPSLREVAIGGGDRSEAKVEVRPSPGRIDPRNAAFEKSRKPLVGLFVKNGHRYVVVNVHLSSKGGDDPAYGTRQPPERASEKQRNRQTEAIADFASRLLGVHPDASLIVLGDFNDFFFSDALAKLEQAGLVNLVKALEPGERYSYVYRGQAQALDHVFVSPNLTPSELDIVHLNSEFPEAKQSSDHDPLLVRVRTRTTR